MSVKNTSTSKLTALLLRLHELYGDAPCELIYSNSFELLVATILSAQCTDKRVNLVTPVLFSKFSSPHALAQAPIAEVEEIVYTTGFFRAKAKNIINMAQLLCREHQGQVPKTLNALIALPGVARKTANVVLGTSFGLSEGVVVDTHVMRLSQRLGLTKNTTPEKIEKDLMALLAKKDWIRFSLQLILHGRRVCMARNPACERCTLNNLCQSAFSFSKTKTSTPRNAPKNKNPQYAKKSKKTRPAT